MSDNRYKRVFHEVLKKVTHSDFSGANELLKGFHEVRDTYIKRALYLVSSDERSPVFSEKVSRDCLDFLDNASDSWGWAEKGRCLLLGRFYERSSHQAEDILTKAIDKEPKAKYYIATIHDLAEHIFDGQKVRDVKYATKLYKDLMSMECSYKEKAALAYCRIAMEDPDSNVNPSEVFTILSNYLPLSEKSVVNQEAYDLMVNFILEHISNIVKIGFSESVLPSGMAEKIEFEGKHRQALSCIDNLRKSLVQ
jgi:hypothetical protein